MNNNENIRRAYSEVYEILNLLDKETLRKIPSGFYKMLEENKDNTYKVNLKLSESLEEQELMQDTINILALIKLNYLCKNEEDKKELINILKENDKKHQEQLQEKYNPDNLFKRYKKDRNNDNPKKQIVENMPVTYKEKFFNKLKKLIKRLF